MKLLIQIIKIACLILLIELFGCKGDMDEDFDPDQVSNIKINNTFDEINRRVRNTNENIGVTSMQDGGRTNKEITLTLVSEVFPQKIEGHILMANTLDMKGKDAAVSYNYAGNQFYGGVDILKFKGDKIVLTSQIALANADVTVTHFDGSNLYFGGASPSSDSTAFVDIVKIKGGELVYDNYKRMRLGGHTTTGIYETDNKVYATTGNTTQNGGGLYVLQSSSLEFLHYQAIEDARWMTYDDNKNPIVLTPTSLSFLKRKDDSYTVNKKISYTADYVSEAKSTAEVDDGFIYVAAGYSGVLILDATDGNQLYTIQLPEDASNEAYVNSVIQWGKIIAFSTGEGVYLADFDSKNPGKENPKIIGRLELGDYQSINHVQRKGNYLVIAAGIGGTKFIKMD